MVKQETLAFVQSLDDKYKYGFETDIESETAPKGLSEDIIRFISAKKQEPQWLTDFRLQAFRKWQQMDEPHWAKLHYEPIDYQNLYYYAAPKKAADAPKDLSEVVANL